MCMPIARQLFPVSICLHEDLEQNFNWMGILSDCITDIRFVEPRFGFKAKSVSNLVPNFIQLANLKLDSDWVKYAGIPFDVVKMSH